MYIPGTYMKIKDTKIDKEIHVLSMSVCYVVACLCSPNGSEDGSICLIPPPHPNESAVPLL